MAASFPDVPDTLTSPFLHTVLSTHPNTHAIHPELPIHPHPLAILRAYLAPADHPPSHVLPPPLADCIAAVRHHQLPRTPFPLDAPPLPIAHAQGMSPKKAHEVASMAAYVVALVRASSLPEDSLHIVDVGAGQGYLTRALKARLPPAHVLALDADEAQTAGAQKWERRVLPDAYPAIAHRTVLIGERTLLAAVDEWIGNGQERASGDGEAQAGAENEWKGARAPVPVLFVALHACGSLTPDVLRAFTAARRRTNPASAWYPAAAVAVGCCYNLMQPSDFPLSTAYRAHPTLPVLPPAAFHLAAQIPSTWVEDPSSSSSSLSNTSCSTFSSPPPFLSTAPPNPPKNQRLTLHPSAALAIRKVVWRALLERALQRAVPLPLPAEASTSPPPPLRSNANSPETFSSDSAPPPADSVPKSTRKPKNKSATVPAHWPRRPEQWVVSLSSAPSAPSSSSVPRAVPIQDLIIMPISSKPTSPTNLTGIDPTSIPIPESSSNLHLAPSSGMGLTPTLRRLGRLRDAAYAGTWDDFLALAAARMGVAFSPESSTMSEAAEPDPEDDGDDMNMDVDADAKDEDAMLGALPPSLRRRALELAALHVLRCIVGVLVESAVLRDRAAWIEEELASTGGVDGSMEMQVALVNLFDQATGSGRNVAIVLAPVLPPPAEG